MISVALASYNGEKYIGEQIESILSQLGSGDELVVSDDGSADATIEILAEFAERDGRVKVLNGPRQGFVKNFENALSHCKGDIIFLSDQDDVWANDKVETVLDFFNKNPQIECVRHDASVVDGEGKVIIQSYNEYRNANVSYFKNIVKNTFTGCCMAFRSEWLKQMLPVPEGLFHDAWFGCISCYFKKAAVIDGKLINWRRHGDNVTDASKRRKLSAVISERRLLLKKLRQKIRVLKKIVK